MSTPTLLTFIAYFIALLGIGFYFYRRSADIEDYLLGGRAMGPWVTALSAQASDMSGWLLMGLPGAIYLPHRLVPIETMCCATQIINNQ